MNELDIMVGVDLGSQNIKAGVGFVNKNNLLEIVGVVTVDSLNSVVQGEVRNINTAMTQVGKALAQLSIDTNLTIGTISTNITSKNMLSLPLAGNLVLEQKGKEVTKQDVTTLADNVKKSKTPMGQILTHIAAQEYGIDGEIKNVYDPKGMPGLNLEGDYLGICFSAITHENIERAISTLPKERKANLVEKIYSILASSVATLSIEERMAGVALVDIGASVTEIAVFYKNVLRYVTTIPVGGEHISQDLQIGLSILPEQAEKIKIFFGNAMAKEAPTNEVVSVPGIGNRNPKDIPVRNIALIIQERVKEISAMILAKLIESEFINRLVAGIVVTGGVAKTENIIELIGQCTGKDVRIGLPNINTRKEDVKHTANPANATLIGLLWSGFKTFDDRIVLTEDSQKVIPTGIIDFGKPQKGNFFKGLFDKIMGENPAQLDDKI